MLLNRALGAALAVILSALSARILTPSQLGSIVITIASVGVLMRIISLGLGQSAQFYGARESSENRNYRRSLLIAALPVTVISSIALYITGPYAAKLVLARDPQAQELFKLLQYGIPLSFIHFVASLYILGRREMRLYFWISQLPVLFSVLILVWGLAAGLGVPSVVWAWMSQYALSFIMGAVVFIRRSDPPGAAPLSSVGTMFACGQKSYVVAMAAFAAGRVGLIMAPWFT
ncbi:MAG TPA: oligosaccharide flippase family protein, partial [Fibrobacteria bacterium]|nr:oligosaccharide flippase family protein [Fibrobacteria bacterium]